MSQMSYTPEFLHIENAFETVKASVNVSEAHGILCGLICASDWVSVDQWVSNILEESTASDSPVFDSIVEAIFQNAQVGFASSGVELYPILPDDDTEISERLAALGEWCHGYLVGLAMTNKPMDTDELPEDISEILRDFAAISQVDVDATEAEESENDYFEIVEFVRVSMYLVYEHIQHINKNDTVH